MLWPRWIVTLPLRVRQIVWQRGAERDLDDELAFHLEMQARANQRAGLPESEARFRARRQFGGVEQSKERCRDVRPLRWADDLRRDVQYAIRTFRHSPGFVVVAVLVLALGIGANTAIFSLVNAVLFRPLSVPGADDLRFLHTLEARLPGLPQRVPYRAFRSLAQHDDLFAGGLAQFSFDQAKIGSGLQPIQVRGEKVSTNYFDVLQARAALGRTFVASDDVAGAGPAIVISDRFWRQLLNANPRVIGSALDLRPVTYGYYSKHHRVYTIVGVMPPGFNSLSRTGLPAAQFWTPIRQRAIDAHDQDREDFGDSGPWRIEDHMDADLVGRLKPGVTDPQVMPAVLAAERQMRAEDNAVASRRRENRRILYGDAATAHPPFSGTGRIVVGRLALALMLVSALVLLIAAINLAGILVARGVARRGEIAMRLALGAGRARVARQVLTETLLLSLAGAVTAVGVARLLIGLFLAYVPSQLGGGAALPLIPLDDVPIDARVLLFTAALGVAAGVLVGLTPTLQALKTDLLPVLSGDSAAPATPRLRARRWILIPQIGLSLVLLLVAGVLVRTLLRAELADHGIEPAKVLRADFALPIRPTMTSDEKRAEAERRRLAYARLLEKVRATPAVSQAALADQSWLNAQPVSVVSRSDYSARQNRWVKAAAVSSAYFETMGIPVVRGRAFDTRDAATTTPVAIVCEQLAQVLWPGKEGVGQYVATYDPKSGAPPPTWLLVVGVAKEVKRPGEEDRTNFYLYTPLAQQAWAYASSIVVRGRVTPQEARQAVVAAIAAADIDIEITRTSTLVDDIDTSLYPRRLVTAILALSGLIGLLLSSVGLYGIVSYSAAQRVREIGIRAALGADRRAIVALMLRDALSSLAIGVVCGVALGVGAVRVVSSFVIALPAPDVPTLVVVPALLCVVILAACLQPARRAARANPIEVLRGL